MGSGKSLSQEENVMSCRAFVSTSETARQGVKRKLEVFKERIGERFIQIQQEKLGGWGKYERMGSALFERYKKAKKKRIKFEGFRRRVFMDRLTGSPTDNQLQRPLFSTIEHLSKICTESYKEMWDSAVIHSLLQNTTSS